MMHRFHFLFWACLLALSCSKSKDSQKEIEPSSDLSVETSSDSSATEELPDTPKRPNPTGVLPLPENGIQVTVGPFDLLPGEEKTMCSYVKVQLDSDREMRQLETGMLAGSHHMNLYFSFTDIDKEGTVECGSDTMGQLIVFGAQQQYHNITLPDGIGYPLPNGQQLILEAHYINTGTEPIEAIGAANLHFAEPGEIKEYAGIMALFPDSINLPPLTQKTITTRCEAPFDAEIFILMSHMHRFGQYFDAYLVDTSTSPEKKTLIYSNDDWHKPEYIIKDHGEFISLNAGDVIEFSCHYKNDENYPVTTGPSAMTNEMCILGLAYVPFHGIVLCQKENAQCPTPVVDPKVDPKSSQCAQYFDCINRCGQLNIGCNNCCSPAMNPGCMFCMQGVLGCAMQNGCANSLENIDMNCISTHCADDFTQCFATPIE